jgi:superfamily II DNA/RNA helicase
MNYHDRPKIISTASGERVVPNLPGEAISFITPEDGHHFKIIQKKMGKWVERIETENLNLTGY